MHPKRRCCAMCSMRWRGSMASRAGRNLKQALASRVPAAHGRARTPPGLRTAWRRTSSDAYDGDAAALARFNAHYGRTFTLEDLSAEIWRRVYAFRQRSSRVPKNYLAARGGADRDRAGRGLRQLGRR